MSKNNITGDKLMTKPQSKAYDKGYDLIFGNKNEIKIEQKEEVKQALKTRLSIEEATRLSKEGDCV
jgi:hypothetical protein